MTRLGLLISTDLGPTDEPPHERYIALRAQVKAAREAGFVQIVMGQHHSFHGRGWLHPVVTAAALADSLKGMRFGLTIYLIGQYHPLEITEQLLSLDAATGGALDIGVAPGWTRAEFAALGIPYEDRVPRFIEALELIKQLWLGEEVTFHGKHFQLDRIRMAHPPTQKPRPPIYMGTSALPGARRAARMADGIVLSAHPEHRDLVLAAEAYRAEFEQLGKANGGSILVGQNCYLGETTHHAMAVASQPFSEWYQSLGHSGLNDDVLEKLAGSAGSDSRAWCAQPGRPLFGDVDRVLEELNYFNKPLGTERIFLRMQWPGMSQQDVLDSIHRAASLLDKNGALRS